MSDSTVTLFG